MKTFNRFSTSRAFTLLELLVVISIIAVLAGILLPVGQGVLERAKRVDAKVTMNSILTAVKAYQTEYGQYPVEPSTGAAVDTTFDTGAGDPTSGKGGRNGLLMDVLRALNNTSTSTSGSAAYKALNSRKIVYFESKDVKNPANPLSGFIPAAGNGTVLPPAGYSPGDLVDPWGNLFCVRIDSNYSDAIMQPYKITGTLTSGVSYQNDTSDTDQTQASQLLRVPAAAWTPGKDQVFGDSTGALTTSCDDVVSWQ